MTPERPPEYHEDDTPQAVYERLEATMDPFSELIPEPDRVSTWEGYIKNKDGEIEYTRPLRSAQANRRHQKLSEFISQADPIKITPSRRKPIQRDHKLLFVFSDAQMDYRLINNELTPIHDERAISVAQMICKDYQPETIVNLGDTIDLAALSRFPSDSDHFNHSLKPAFNRVHRMYAELRADNPNSRIVEVDSNHNTRLGKFVLKNAPHLYGLTRPGTEDNYPVLSYAFLANLDALNVEWISGYGAAGLLYGDNQDLLLIHGTNAVSTGSTAAKTSKENPEVNVIQGHAHRMETFNRTTRSGKYLSTIVVGALCRTTGEVPSYHSAVDDKGDTVKYQENWQQGVLMVTDYGGSNFSYEHIPINNGQANYRGKHYAA